MKNPADYIYVTHHAYGISTFNIDGNRANEIHRFSAPKDAEAFIENDPERRSYASYDDVVRIQKDTVKAGGSAEGFPMPFMDRPFRVGR